MKLADSVILSNAEKFKEILNSFGDRSERLNKLYDDFGEWIYIAPASSMEHFHNTCPGGYVDHVLRVIDFAEKHYKFFQLLGMETDTFSLEELRFAALNHDLGKIGFPIEGYSCHVPNTSEWHIKNQGKLYEINPNMPWASVVDKSLFLLQAYSIPYSWNEFMAIRLHDGVYEEANKQYYLTFSAHSKFRSNIMMCLHHADMLASRWEYERWVKLDKKIPGNMNFNKSMIKE